MKNEEQVLEKKEENIQAILNATKDPLLLVNLDGNVITLNEIAAKKLSKSVDELISSSIYDIMPPNDIKFSKAQINKITYSQNPVRVEKEMFGRSFEYSSYPNFDVQGKVEKIAISANNLIEHKKVEKEFSLKIEQFQKLLDHSPAVIFSFTPQRDFAINFLSKNVKKRLGYDPRKFINNSQSWVDCVHPDDLPNLFSQLTVLLEKGFITSEYRFKHKDGTYRWIYDEKRVVYDKNGQPSEVIGSWFDITDRKKKEEELEEAYSELKQIFNITIPLCAIDKKFNIIRINNTFSSLFNVKREEIIGRKCYDIIHGPLCNTPECTTRQILGGKDCWEYEKDIELVNGTKNVYNMRAVPYRAPNNEIIGVIQNYTDITKQKKADQLLRDSEEFLQNVFDGFQDGISVLDKDLNIIRTNYWMEKMYFSEVPLIGKKCYSVYQKRISPCPWCPSKTTLKTGDVHSTIAPYPSAENPVKWLEIITFPLKNSEGLTVGIVEYIKDVTERKHMEEKLQESKNKYHILFEEAGDSILIIDTDTGELVDFNAAAYRNLGYNYEEFKQIQLKDIEAVETTEEIKRHVKKINRKGYGNFETKHRTKDGKIKDIHVIAKPITIRGKSFLISMCRDITERKKIKDMLKLNRERYSLATHAAKVGVWDWNIENGEFYLDPNVKMILGYSDEEIPNDPDVWETYIHPDDSKGAMEAVQAHLEGKTLEYFYKHRMLHKDGSIRWIQDRGRTIRDTQGNAIRMVGTNVDISEQKEAEEKLKLSKKKLKMLNKELEQKVEERTKDLRESEEKYRNVINNISDVLMEGNIHGMITYISPQICDIIGYQPKELIGLKFFKFLHPKEKITYEELINKTGKAGDKFSTELRVLHKKGYYVPISAKGSLEEINNKLKMFVVIRDITEKRKIDNMMKKEIKKLKDLDQIRSDLIRRISHELKTPLISIFSGTQYLLNECNDYINDNVQDIVKFIHKGGYRLKSLVDNLLIAYNIESNELNLNLKRENLIPIIKNCIDDVIFIANKRKVFINIELLKELYLDIDKSKINNAISNILSNAVKNTLANGNVYIKTFEHPKYVDIIIKDDGVGLTKREMPLLFKKFGKIERYGKNMNVDIEGPGLGLYISNEIVKLHNGEIIIKSKGRNKGSTFTIRLCRK